MFSISFDVFPAKAFPDLPRGPWGPLSPGGPLFPDFPIYPGRPRRPRRPSGPWRPVAPAKKKIVVYDPRYNSWSGYFYVHGKKLSMQTKVTDSVTSLLVKTA